MSAHLLKVLAACVLLLAVSIPAAVRAQIDHPDRDAILERMNALTEIHLLPIPTVRQRANAGDLRAMYALSLRYQNGIDVPQSFAQYDQWTARVLVAATEAMADGDAYASYMHTLQTWLKTSMSDAELLRRYRPAAEAGVPEAMFEVGRAHYWGRGTPENKAEALRWFELAATAGHCEAIRSAAVLYVEPGQGAPDAARGAQWYRIAAEDPTGCGNGANAALASLYSKGEGNVPINHGEALRYLIRAAERGNPVAALTIGFYYEKGLGVPIDRAEALRWFQLAGYPSVEAARQGLAELGLTEPS